MPLPSLSGNKIFTVVGGVIGTAVTVTFAPTVGVVAVTFVGFNCGDILAGSLAARFMASYGGTVGGGYACAVLKSIGAKGAFSAARSDAARAAARVVTSTMTVLARGEKKEQGSDKDEGHSEGGRERDDTSYHDGKCDDSDGEGEKVDGERKRADSKEEKAKGEGSSGRRGEDKEGKKKRVTKNSAKRVLHSARIQETKQGKFKLSLNSIKLECTSTPEIKVK